MVGSQRSDNGYLLEIARDAMACRFEVLLHPGLPTDGPEIACRALDCVTYLEQLWSVYLPTSELSILNSRGMDVPVSVSGSTIQLLEQARRIWEQTDAAFDITAAKLTKTWGFFRRQGAMPTEAEILQSIQSIGTQHIQVDRENATVRFRSPVEVNPGGIGKGMAIDQAAQILESAGIEHYAIHGGKSSIRCRGQQFLNRESSDLAGWSIAVRHPEQSECLLGTLNLMDQALGTSGPANQFFYFRGKRYGHIIDPRTGWPADTMLSITVLHPSAGWADALATGLYVLGTERTIDYCERNRDTAVLMILPGKKSGQVEVITCNLLPGQWVPA